MSLARITLGLGALTIVGSVSYLVKKQKRLAALKDPETRHPVNLYRINPHPLWGKFFKPFDLDEKKYYKDEYSKTITADGVIQLCHDIREISKTDPGAAVRHLKLYAHMYLNMHYDSTKKTYDDGEKVRKEFAKTVNILRTRLHFEMDMENVYNDLQIILATPLTNQELETKESDLSAREVRNQMVAVIDQSSADPESIIKKYPPFIPGTGFYSAESWYREGVRVKNPKNASERLDSLGLTDVIRKIKKLKAASPDSIEHPKDLVTELGVAASKISVNLAACKKTLAGYEMGDASGELFKLIGMIDSMVKQSDNRAEEQVVAEQKPKGPGQ